MSFYGEMATLASDLIGQFGREMTFTRTPKTANGAIGSATSGTATTTKGKVVVLPASKGTIEAFDNRTEDGSLAGQELRYLKIAALGMSFVPRKLDTVYFDSATWQVLGCTPVNPAGTPIVYGAGVVKL